MRNQNNQNNQNKNTEPPDFIKEIFGSFGAPGASGSPSPTTLTPRVGDEVHATLSEGNKIKGVLKALPNATMGFCVVYGTIIRVTEGGELHTKDTNIIVPLNLLRLTLGK